MGIGKYYPKELKEEVVEKIKTSGKPVSQIASEYGVNVKSVYNWLRGGIKQDGSVLEINRLKRQNDELMRLIGEVIFELKKKRKDNGGK